MTTSTPTVTLPVTSTEDDPSGSVYGSLFAGVDSSQASILVLGDSLAEGFGVSSITERWPNLVQDGLRVSNGLTGGVGYSESYNASNSITDDPTRVATTTLTGAQGLGHRGVQVSTGSVTYPARSCTGLMVWASTMNQSGVLAVTVDGGTPTLIPTGSNEASYRDRWWYVPLGVSASRTVVVTRSSAGTGFFPTPTLSGVQFLDGDDVPPETYLSVDGSDGSSASCPDSSGLDITGDIDIRVRFRVPDSTLADEQCLIAKWDSLASQRSYMLTVDTSGKLKGYWSTAGTVTLSQAATSMSAIAADTWVWGRWTLDVDNGASGRTHNFYLSTTDTDDHTAVTWGSPVSTHTTAGTTSIHAGTALVRVGQFTTGVGFFFKTVGDFRAAAVLDGSTVKADPVWSRSTSSLVNDSAGNTWTAQTAAGIVLDNTGTGIQVLNCAQSGYAASNYAAGDTGVSATVSDLRDWTGGTDAALAIIALGVNDYLADTDPADFATDMQAIIDGLRDGQPDLPVLLIVTWAPDATQDYEWSEYVDRMYTLADSNDCRVLDFTAHGWPQPGTDEGDASGYYGDLVHLTEAGHVAVAARVLAELVGAEATSGPSVTNRNTSTIGVAA